LTVSKKEITFCSTKITGEYTLNEANLLRSKLVPKLNGNVYFTDENLIAVQKAELAGITYLYAYNFGVILPLLIIGTAIVVGLSPTKVDRFRKEKRAMIRLVTGIILVVLGAFLTFGRI